MKHDIMLMCFYMFAHLKNRTDSFTYIKRDILTDFIKSPSWYNIHDTIFVLLTALDSSKLNYFFKNQIFCRKRTFVYLRGYNTIGKTVKEQMIV